MTLTPRDKKIVLVLVPIVLLLGYWFLLLSPQRKDAAAAGEALEKQEQRLGAAEAQLAQLNSVKTGFAAEYGSLVRLGKAVPSSVDMPTLLVQLEAASKGTGIRFTKVKTGERDETAAAPPAQPPKAPAPGGSQGAAGAAQPQAQQSGAGAGAPGLDTVPLEFEFKGRFARLADFFHEVKRFVRASNDRIAVNGRLLTVDSLKFTSGELEFPRLTAEVKATVYLAPKTQGTTAGASPAGPQTPAATAPGGSGAPSATPGAPTAAATP